MSDHKTTTQEPTGAHEALGKEVARQTGLDPDIAKQVIDGQDHQEAYEQQAAREAAETPAEEKAEGDMHD